MDERFGLMESALLRYKSQDNAATLKAATEYLKEMLAKPQLTEKEHAGVVELLNALTEDTGDPDFADLAAGMSAGEKHLSGMHDQQVHGAWVTSVNTEKISNAIEKHFKLSATAIKKLSNIVGKLENIATDYVGSSFKLGKTGNVMGRLLSSSSIV